MRFDPALQGGTLVRRYKRFLADVRDADGEVVTMHCANTGAMTGCAEPGSRVWYSTSANPRRKYRHSWELVENPSGELICVNTARGNQLVAEAFAAGTIELGLHEPLGRETRIPGDDGRFDFGSPEAVVEVKNVTLATGDRGAFPDAVSERATRHVRALARCVAQGMRAILIFVAPHSGIRSITTADDVDPVYGTTLREAARRGVEVRAYGCRVSPCTIAVSGELPVRL